MISNTATPHFMFVLVMLALSGCGSSAQPHFYRLDSVAAPDSAPSVQTRVMVGPVVVPAAVNQPQLVLQVAPNRVNDEELDRCDAPLVASSAAAAGGTLSAL